MSKFTGKYPADWKGIAVRIKAAHGWKCIRCGHPHDPSSGYCLTIHHADNDKSNCRWYNLLCLCQKCHLQIQAKVILNRPWLLPHSEWFKPYVAGYYAAINGKPTDETYVCEHIDELLDIGQPVRMSAAELVIREASE